MDWTGMVMMAGIFTFMYFILIRPLTKRFQSTHLGYSVTQYVSAALHDGPLKPQTVLDRLQDRHRAPLPEIGLDVAAVVHEAKVARRRDTWFGCVYLLLSFWLFAIVIDIWLLSSDDHRLERFAGTVVWIVLGLCAVGVFKKMLVVGYLRKHFAVAARTSVALGPDNVTVFGGFSPFAGFGFDLDGWSFTIDTTKPAEGKTARPAAFTQVELLDCVAAQLRANIDQVEVADRLFVSGRGIRNSKAFLSDPIATPTTRVGPELVAEHIGDSRLGARHYRVVCLPFADHHLALTMFLRSTMVGHNVFIELRTFLLNAIRPEFTSLNRLATDRGPSLWLVVVRNELMKSVIAWLNGYAMLLSLLSRWQQSIADRPGRHPEDQQKVSDADYNYGHLTSFRETLAAERYGSYFQMIDKDRALKTSQHIILNTLVDFFESKGIATDDIRERRTQIFNSGVIVSGGVVTAQQMAVGPGATAVAKASAAVNPLRQTGGAA